MLGKKALYNRLNSYFTDNYGKYEMTSNWYPDCTDITWKCDIKELNRTIILVCDPETGVVKEYSKTMNKNRGNQ